MTKTNEAQIKVENSNFTGIYNTHTDSLESHSMDFSDISNSFVTFSNLRFDGMKAPVHVGMVNSTFKL